MLDVPEAFLPDVIFQPSRWDGGVMAARSWIGAYTRIARVAAVIRVNLAGAPRDTMSHIVTLTGPTDHQAAEHVRLIVLGFGWLWFCRRRRWTLSHSSTLTSGGTARTMGPKRLLKVCVPL